MAVLGIIFVVILAIVLISHGGGPKQGPRPVVVSDQNREGTSVQFTNQGRLVGEDKRRAIRIVVSQNERRLEILTGYEEAVERAQVYPNTPAAYENFLIALDKAGFDNKRVVSDDDERGSCPLGYTYIYQLKDFSQELIRTWSTSCSARTGTFSGNPATIRTLFQLQIPDYATQTQNVDLTGAKPTATTTTTQ